MNNPYSTKPEPEDPEAWREDALCRQIGGDWWFAEKSELSKTRMAKEICAQCPVAAQCLEYGLKERWGIFGGLTLEERRALRRQRKESAA